MIDRTLNPQAEEQKLRLGGMALRNGLLIHGPTHWAVAVRGEDQKIHTASGRKPHVKGVDRIPLLRGAVRLGESMLVIPLVKRSLRQAQLPYGDRVVFASAVAASLAGTLLRRVHGGLLGEVAVGGVSLAPPLLALGRGDLAAYHGAEHKAIGAYEQGIEDASTVPKEHERCGSHLVGPMMLGGILGGALLRSGAHKPNRKEELLVSTLSAGGAVELFLWMQRHRRSRIAKVLSTPGYWLQYLLGTREPTAEQLAVAQAAVEEILKAECESL